MHLIPLKSQLIESGSDLLPVLDEALRNAGVSLENGDLLVVASKVVAYSQGRLVVAEDKTAFRKWVHEESDRVLDEGEMVLTLKNNILIPNAGIDNSNTPQGKAVLWPREPFRSARDLRRRLMEEYGLESFGVVVSDSHCQPLRMGTSGIAIGWAGFRGVTDDRGKTDLFGKPMHYTREAVADNLASSANLLMGETDASIPFVVVRGFPAQWTGEDASAEDYFIPPDQCLYKPLYNQNMF
jgi:coenzyme F420-0:L-glutamate ligase